MTANVLQEDVQQYLDAGMDAYVSKPIRKAELMAAIASLAPKAKFGAIPESGDSGKTPAGLSQGERSLR